MNCNKGFPSKPPAEGRSSGTFSFSDKNLKVEYNSDTITVETVAGLSSIHICALSSAIKKTADYLFHKGRYSIVFDDSRVCVRLDEANLNQKLMHDFNRLLSKNMIEACRTVTTIEAEPAPTRLYVRKPEKPSYDTPHSSNNSFLSEMSLGRLKKGCNLSFTKP